MRRFYIHRKEDVTGMSGTGRVGDGIEFENGQVALTWKKELPSVTIFQSISVLERLHTHNGSHQTKIVWIDDVNEDVVARAKELQSAKLEELQKEAEEEQAAEEATSEETIKEENETDEKPESGDDTEG